jgi:Domain of unknown function (DUF3883)
MFRDPVDQASVELPSRHMLRAALLAGHALTAENGTPLSQLPASWLRTPSDGVYSPGELNAGCALLIEARFVSVSDQIVIPAVDLNGLLAQAEDDACREILYRLIDERRPLWIGSATADGEVAPEMIPDAAAAALRQAFPDPAEREKFLLAMGRRFSDADAKRIGELAEAHVTEVCRTQLDDVGRSDLAALVRRVSLTSDQLGFDVTAPRLDRSTRRLEVKGTRTVGPHLLIVISLNEAKVAARDPNWFLVVCRVATDDTVVVLGWTTYALLAPRLPVDQVDRGGWLSAAVPIEESELTSGLPPWDAAA